MPALMIITMLVCENHQHKVYVIDSVAGSLKSPGTQAQVNND